MCPPSMPINAAILRSAAARRMSAPVVAKDEILCVHADRLPDLVDEEERTLDGGRTRDGARDPDGEELRVKPSLAHSRNVDVAVSVTRAQIKARFEQQSLRSVRMPVDNKGIHMGPGGL